jgi:RNA polymerase sigma-70 factor (ECF subfamily)
VEKLGTDVDQRVRGLVQAQDLDAALTETLEVYGAEVFGFLIAIHRNETDAGDVFSIFSERLWKSLASFEWNCTLRTWAYTIARNASHRFSRDRGRRRARELPEASSGVVEAVAVQVRTRTLTYLRTETKTEIQKLRDELDADDQTLLILRLDRGLEWNEIAQVFLTSDAPADAQTEKREAARLRKRFQLVKERLTRLAKERGLISRS